MIRAKDPNIEGTDPTFPQLSLLHGCLREDQLSVLSTHQFIPPTPTHNLIPISVHVHVLHRTLPTERTSGVRVRTMAKEI